MHQCRNISQCGGFRWRILARRWECTWKSLESPNTAIGLAFGGMGHVVGEVAQALGLWDKEPTIGFGNNAIEFMGNPFGFGGALTLGNTITWGVGRDSNFYNSFSPHETRHTMQGQFMGVLYIPAHIAAMSSSLLLSPVHSTRRTVPGATIAHGKTNFMEGPIFRDELY
jgi:hypothetical protein